MDIKNNIKKFNSNEKARTVYQGVRVQPKGLSLLQRGQVFSIHQEVFKTTGVFEINLRLFQC